jgi:hypothetical protein
MDINSLVSKYLQLNGNSEANIDDIKESLLDIKNSSGFKNDLSIFVCGDEATQESFYDYMSKAAGRDDDNFKEEVSLLFNILDSDQSGNISDDELDFMKRTKGANSGKVDTFSFWKSLDVDESEVIENISEAVNNAETTLSELAALYGEDSDIYKQVLAQVNGTEAETSSETTSTVEDEEVADSSSVESTTQEDTTDETTIEGTTSEETTTETSSTTTSSSVVDFSSKESMQSFVSSFIDETMQTPTEVINWLQENGIITDEQAQQLQSAYVEYSEDDQKKISALMQLGKTYDEAVETLTNSGKIEGNSTLEKTTYKEINVEQYANDLYKAMDGLGTDEEALKTILNDEEISDDDFAKIVAKYEELYGVDAGGKGLVTRLENETSGDLQTSLTSKLAERLIKAAENGNTDVIDTICKEVYSGTAGQNCTANDFLAGIFASTTSDSVINDIYSRYSQINTGHNLVDDIKNDYSGIFGWRNWLGNQNASGDGATFIAKIQNAVRHNS